MPDPESERSSPEDPLRAQVARVLRDANRALASSSPANLAPSLARVDDVIARLQTPARPASVENLRLLAAAFAGRGNLLREQATTDSRASAIAAYDEALAILEAIEARHVPGLAEDRANAWTNRGITLLTAGAPDQLRESIVCFDKAIALRTTLDLDPHPWSRYGLAAGWMNRGDALTRLGALEDLALALDAYAEALAHLRRLPIDQEPLFRRRLAIAWMNRGITLQKQSTELSFEEALRSFDAAIEILGSNDPKAAPILACAWMNRGNTSLRLIPAATADARSAALQALARVEQLEREDPVCAEVGFKARHILCQACAQAPAAAETGADGDRITEALEAVDSGMALAHHWEGKGVHTFRSLVRELFRFGARAYQAWQPHFLAEFLIESLDPEQSESALPGSQEMHAAAIEALWLSIRQIQRSGFRAMNTPEFDKLLETLRELRLTEERLEQLHKAHRDRNGRDPGG